MENRERLPYQDAEKQLIVRFLSISSYLLKGDSDKGVDELREFSKYYFGTGGQQFRISDNWSFVGLTDFITKSSVSQKDKDILFDIISILKGNRQGWTRINAIIEESNKIRHAASVRRRKIGLIVAGIAIIAIAAVAYQYFTTSINQTYKKGITVGFQQGINYCGQIPKPYSFPIEKTITDTVFDPYNDSRLYLADYDLGQVLVFDTKCQKVIKYIPVGKHPVSLVFNDTMLFVANMDSDTISIIPTKFNNPKIFEPKTIHAGSAPRDIRYLRPKNLHSKPRI